MKRWQRAVSTALVLVILVMTFSVPVKAAETDTGSYINVLDFATANGSGENSFSSNGTTTATAVYDIAYSPYLRYADIVITSAGGDPTSIAINGTQLTLVKIESRLYRAFGTFVVTSGDMTITATSDAVGVRYSIVSFKAGTSSSSLYPQTGFLAVGTHLENSSYIYMEDAESPAEYKWWYSGVDGRYEDFIAYIYLQHWTRYDYLDVILNLNVTSLEALTITLGDSILEYEISYFEAAGSDWYIRDWQDISNLGDDSTDFMKRRFMVTIRIDLTTVDRTFSGYPCITLRGTYGQVDGGSAYEVELTSSTGHVVSESPSAVAYWLMKVTDLLASGQAALQTAISTLQSNIMTGMERTQYYTNQVKIAVETWAQKIINAIRGDTAPGDQFQDDLQEELDELDKSQSILDSVAKPDVGGDIGNITIDDDTKTGMAVYGNILTSIIETDYISTVFMMAFMMALLSYILYGRR